MSLTLVRHIAARLRTLPRDEGAATIIEFAFMLPILVTVTLFGVEVANYAIVNTKISQTALSVADNAARVRDSIDEANVNEIFSAAKLLGGGYNVTNGRIILSSVERNSKGGAYIRWQRCKGAKVFTSSYGAEGANATTATPVAIGPAGNQIAPIDGSPIMFVEIAYDYVPVFSSALITRKTITYTAAMTVRQRTDQVLRRADSSTPQSLCNVYST